MPRAPRKCAGPGCENRITNTRYCPEHTTWNWNPQGGRDQAHRVWAKAIKRRDQYMCQIKGPTCLGRGTIADHITPTAEGGRDTSANGQCVCEPCHTDKTQAEAQRGQQRAQERNAPAPF